MNHTATSREELLRACLKTASTEGLSAINIRHIAKDCNVSVGCVYGYFPSKAELVSATIAKIWEHIFHMTEGNCCRDDFRGCVRWIFDCICLGSQEYPSFFRLHSTAFADADKNEGRKVMMHYLGHIHAAMLQTLQHDPHVRREVFDQTFPEDDFVSFVFDHLFLLGTRSASSCDYLIRLIEKLAY